MSSSSNSPSRDIIPLDFAKAEQRIAALESALEADRTKVAECLTAANQAIDSRHWLTEGRGPYEWDDDNWREEFRAAAIEIKNAIAPLTKIAADWKNCPVDARAIAEARQNYSDRIAALESELQAERYRSGELARRNHIRSGHLLPFEKCESVWCNPRKVGNYLDDPALDCAKYREKEMRQLSERIAKLEADNALRSAIMRERLANWMTANDYVPGQGDTAEELFEELSRQHEKRQNRLRTLEAENADLREQFDKAHADSQIAFGFIQLDILKGALNGRDFAVCVPAAKSKWEQLEAENARLREVAKRAAIFTTCKWRGLVDGNSCGECEGCQLAALLADAPEGEKEMTAAINRPFSKQFEVWLTKEESDRLERIAIALNKNTTGALEECLRNGFREAERLIDAPEGEKR